MAQSFHEVSSRRSAVGQEAATVGCRPNKTGEAALIISAFSFRLSVFTWSAFHPRQAPCQFHPRCLARVLVSAQRLARNLPGALWRP